MADFEDAVNLEQMTDADVEALVQQELTEDRAFDADAVEIRVEEGQVTVEGRVGTEQERQRVSQLLTGLGASDFENDVVVDESTRAQRDEAADEARVEDQSARAQMGESGKSTTDTAEHLNRPESDRLYGTKDPKEAAQEGIPYTPPDRPVQEGMEGDEDH